MRIILLPTKSVRGVSKGVRYPLRGVSKGVRYPLRVSKVSKGVTVRGSHSKGVSTQ